MASTYTLNNGIELIGTGEQSGTWGDTTNTNLSLLDTALDGQVTVTLATAGTSGSPNALPISDGSASDGRNRMIIFADGGDLGATAYVQLTPNDAEKIIYIRNDLSGSRSILFFQGTYNASNDYEVPAGTTAVIYFDGGGTGAVAANVFNNAYFDSLRLGSVSVTAIIDDDTMATASATNIATSESIKAYVDTQVGANNELSEVLANGNTSGGNNIQMTTTDELQFRDTALKISSSADGQLDIDADTEIEIVAPTVDIDASTAMTIDTAALTVTGAVDLNTSLNVDGTVTSDGLTVAGNVSVDGGTIKLDGNYPNGTGNVAFGDTALDSLTTGGNYNIAIGHNNSTAITTGDNNVSLGAFALTTTTTSSSNTAIGYSALELNVTGSGNVALGNKSMEEGVTALNNTGVGNQAGRFLSDEIVATAIVSGVNYTIQTTGTTDFTLIGAADSNPGTTFTATGAGTGTGTASANVQLNTFVGYKSGELVVGGSKNTILGGFDGNQNTIDIRNSDNNIVLSDGDGNPRLAYVSDNAELVINEQSADVDFRVESNADANCFVVNAGTDRVAVGVSNPSGKFEIFGSNAGDIMMRIINSAYSSTDSSGDNKLQFGWQNHTGASIVAFKDGTINRTGFKINTEVGFNVETERLKLGSNGSLTLTPDGSGHAVFNEDSADADFRVESDSNTHMLFVDAGNNYVGFGKSTLSGGSGSNIVDGIVQINCNASETALRITRNGVDFGGYNINFGADNISGGVDYYDFSFRPSWAAGVGSAGDMSGLRFATPYGGQNSVVFNENSQNLDFRVESDSNTNMLLVDAGLDRVQIAGTANTPTASPVLMTHGYTVASFGTSPVNPSGTDILSSSRFSIGGDGGNYLNFGIYENATATGTSWIQSSYYVPNTAVYDLTLQPLGGNVGIGDVPNPATQLHIENSGIQTLHLQRNNATVGSEIGYVTIGSGSSYTAGMYAEIRSGQPGIDRVDLVLGTTTYTTSLQTMRERLRLKDAVEAVVNDLSDNYDFRVESDGNSHALFVDAGTNTTLVKKSSKEGPTASALEVSASFDADTATIASGSSHDFPLYGAASAAMVLVHTCSSANTNANRADLLLINPRNSAFGGGNQIVTVSTAHGSTGTSQEPSVTFSSVASGNAYWLRVTPSNSAASNLIVSIREVSIMA